MPSPMLTLMQFIEALVAGSTTSSEHVLSILRNFVNPTLTDTFGCLVSEGHQTEHAMTQYIAGEIDSPVIGFDASVESFLS
jgi:hypothetical protein